MISFLPRTVVCFFVCGVMFLFLASPALHGQDQPGPLESALDAPEPLESTTSSPAERNVACQFSARSRTSFVFSRELAQGRHWAPIVVLGAGTVSLLSTEPHFQPFFADTKTFHEFDRIFSSRITGVETLAVPVTLYAVGFGRHDSYMQKTALFAAEAVADSEMVRILMNSVTRRWRPQDIYTGRTYSNTFFRSRSYVGSSFPSGHTIAALSSRP
jgi:hypothetical protein